MTDRLSRTVIAITVIAGMLVTGIGFAFAEPYHVLSGRDKIGTYGKDGKSARAGYINSMVFEGGTTDTNETFIYATDPTSDNTILLPDSSGTISLTSGGVVGVNTVGSAQIIDNTVASADILNGTIASVDILDNSVTTSDILNSTILSIDIAIANVQASDIFINTVSATVPANETGTEVTVESGSILIDTQLVSGFSNDVTLTKSILVGTTWIINSDAGPAHIVNGIFLKP